MRQYDNQQVAEIIEVEGGLGSCVEGYLHENNIADPELAGLWKQARSLLKQISDKLRLYEED